MPHFLTELEITNLKQTGFGYATQLNRLAEPLVKWSRADDEQRLADPYFLESGDKVRYFLEAGATNSKGLLVPKEMSINKIGHGLHIVEPTFRDLSTSDKIKAIVKALGYQHPEIVQSMLIFKQPRIGEAVPPHQDSTFLYTEPPSALGFWIPLEDCTEENGCLYFYPGSHQLVPISRRFKRTFNSLGQTLDVTMVGADYSSELCDLKRYVPVVIPAGTLVLIHGSVLHTSGANHSEISRLAYTFHIVEGEAEYSKENWLQLSTPFTRLY